jgi:Tfp pilus assembly protein FimV
MQVDIRRAIETHGHRIQAASLMLFRKGILQGRLSLAKANSARLALSNMLREFGRESAAANPGRFRLALPAIVLLIATGGVGFWMFRTNGYSPSAAPGQRAPAELALVATDAQTSRRQQETFEQVQALQQELAAQQAETKRLSDGFDALSRKVDALQQSFASAPVAKAAAPKRKPAQPGSTRLAPFIQ